MHPELPTLRSKLAHGKNGVQNFMVGVRKNFKILVLRNMGSGMMGAHVGELVLATVEAICSVAVHVSTIMRFDSNSTRVFLFRKS